MIVVFGSQGQLGRALEDALGESPTHVFLHRDSQDYCGDIGNSTGLTETLLELRPTIIINAAAYTAVDLAESEPEKARAINAQAVGVLAQITSRLNSLLVHYSTDYVFDGSKERPWQETDMCDPVSIYGQTKLEGERLIQASGARHFILRTSWVYGGIGNNFLRTMLRLAETREEIQIVDDQWGAPTHVDLLADVTLNLINISTPGLGANTSRKPPAWGIYHCASAGSTSWFEYAKLVINTAKSVGAASVCQRITPIPTKNYPTAAQRPLNSRLDTSKLQKTLGISFPDWRESVVTTVREILSQQHSLDLNHGKSS
jgi:dTDP-4-dehydrorhamnose reductase